MANFKLPFLLLFLLIFTSSRVQSHEEGHITAEISNKGLDFLKDLLIQNAETSLVPLELPEIKKSAKIPIIGSVQMILSNIRIESIHVTSSTVKAGDSGVVIDVSGATANLSMSWKYAYSSWLIPISVSDKGNASIQVAGLEVGLTLSLKTIEGSLRLSLLECGCYVKNISIKVDGGASWLYQGLLDAFQDKIGSAVEDAVPKKIKDAILKLDSLLQSHPKEVPVTNIAAVNVTIVDDPEVSESSVDLQIDGLFSAKHEVDLPSYYHRMLRASAPRNIADKMVRISLHEDVLKSAVLVYFEVISGTVSADISGNTVYGSVKLDDFTMFLEWSRIGDLHMYLIQTLISATLRTVALPYVNSKLREGFQIPAFHGYELQNAQILCTDDWIVICSDVAPVQTIQTRLFPLH